MALGAVIVAGHCARADIGELAHIGIADIAEVTDLHAFVQNGVLDFDEVADMHIFGQFRAGSQSGKGADIGAVFGGAGSQALFGSAGPADFLNKATRVLVVVFMLTSSRY